MLIARLRGRPQHSNDAHSDRIRFSFVRVTDRSDAELRLHGGLTEADANWRSLHSIAGSARRSLLDLHIKLTFGVGGGFVESGPSHSDTLPGIGGRSPCDFIAPF